MSNKQNDIVYDAIMDSVEKPSHADFDASPDNDATDSWWEQEQEWAEREEDRYEQALFNSQQ